MTFGGGVAGQRRTRATRRLSSSTEGSEGGAGRSYGYGPRVHRDAPSTDELPPNLRAMIADGRAVAPRRDLREVLREIELPPAPPSDAGTRALQEQRGDRGLT